MRLQDSPAGVYNFLQREFNFDSQKAGKAEQLPLSDAAMKNWTSNKRC